MNLEPIADVNLEVPGSGGLTLTDLQTEPLEVRLLGAELGAAALQSLVDRTVPGVLICAFRSPTAEGLGPKPDREKGEIAFAVWKNRRREDLLGLFHLYNIEAEVDTPKAFVFTSHVAPMFETGSPARFDNARKSGAIMRHLLDAELVFESGRACKLVEWVFPIFAGYQGKPGEPINEEWLETLEVTRGKGNQERHARADFEHGPPKSMRHGRADEIVRDFRGR